MNIFSLHDWVEFGYNEWKNLAGTAENSKQRTGELSEAFPASGTRSEDITLVCNFIFIHKHLLWTSFTLKRTGLCYIYYLWQRKKKWSLQFLSIFTWKEKRWRWSDKNRDGDVTKQHPWSYSCCLSQFPSHSISPPPPPQSLPPGATSKGRVLSAPRLTVGAWHATAYLCEPQTSSWLIPHPGCGLSSRETSGVTFCGKRLCIVRFFFYLEWQLKAVLLCRNRGTRFYWFFLLFRKKGKFTYSFIVELSETFFQRFKTKRFKTFKSVFCFFLNLEYLYKDKDFSPQSFYFLQNI